MSGSTLLQVAYLASAVLFILGLRMLSSPKTAPRGNLMAAVGMFIAVVATLVSSGVVDYRWIALGAAIGGGLGAVAAMRVAMTAMPQLVALLHSFVGLAAGPLLVGYLSDFLQARFAEEALRYSLLVPTFAPMFSVLVCLLGASAVKADLDRAQES